MGFTSPELSIQTGRIVELYRFRTPSGQEWRFTNAEETITDADTLEYTPTAILREQYAQSQQRRATEMTVSMPFLDDSSLEFAQHLITLPSEGVITLTIQRHHLTDAGSEFVQFWEGNVISTAYDEDGGAEFLCKGFKNIFEREGPRARWGGLCQHILYDARCGLNAALFTSFNATVDSIAADGITITLSGIDSPIPVLVNGKMIKDNGLDHRLIVAQSGNILTIAQPFRDDFVAGVTVDLEQGCTHDVTACQNQFSNINNYGGFPYTPGLNPFQEGLDKL